MEWLLRLLGVLTGHAISSAGEKVADKVIPMGRPTARDKRSTARMLKGDMAELYTLYSRLYQYTDQAEETCNDLCWLVVGKADEHRPELLESPLLNDAHHLCLQLLADEGYFPILEIDFTRQLPLGQIWALKKSVQRYLSFYESQTRQEEIAKVLEDFLFYNLFHKDMLPAAVFEQKSEELTFAAPLYSLCANTALSIEFVIGNTFRTPEDDGTFSNLGKRLEYNMCVASGIDPTRMEESHKQPVKPTEAIDKSPVELVESYLAGTPFRDFFNINVPFTIPEEKRFEHMHIVAGSGHGKTQTLQNLILSDLSKIRDGERSVIVIDSQGDLLRKIQNLAALKEIAEQLVIIDPTDIDYPPALNLFDFGLDRLHLYNAYDRESLINGAIDMYEYVFGVRCLKMPPRGHFSCP